MIGVIAFDPNGVRKPLGNGGTLNIAGGDRVGLACAACHAGTDNSILAPNPGLKTVGSIGREVDGPTPHQLDVGRNFAAAQNSLALYPLLQLRFNSLNNASIGRGNFPGLDTTATAVATKAQADTYLTGTDSRTGDRFYPIGQFDSNAEGVGNPVHIMPLFRTDLAAPWGTDGGTALLDDFNNGVFTIGLDPTSVLTAAGRQFLSRGTGAAHPFFITNEQNRNDVIEFLRSLETSR